MREGPLSPLSTGLEALGGLAWCQHNELPITTTSHDVYQRMVELLLVADCQLILHSLDSLYHLSFYGGEIGLSILSTTHCVDVLFSLLKFGVDQLSAAAVEGIVLLHPNGKTEIPAMSVRTELKKSMRIQPSVEQSATKLSSSSSSSSSSLTQSTARLTAAPQRDTKTTAPLKLLTNRSIMAVSQLQSPSSSKLLSITNLNKNTPNNTTAPQNKHLSDIEW